MRGSGGVIAVAVAAASLLVSAAAALAQAGGVTHPLVLLFAGTDLWRQSQFFHGGVLMAPAGLDSDGFTIKMLIGGGHYSYYSGGLAQDVDGRAISADALFGWRFRRDALTVNVSAGVDVQDHQLVPNDPGARLRGHYVGARLSGDFWYQPTAQFMVAADASATTVGPTTSFRAATGWRVFDTLFIGPETQMLWCADYRQLRLGIHFTGLHTDIFEWLLASGWARDSDGRAGPYLRLGVIASY
jgi:hypothetical protein